MQSIYLTHTDQVIASEIIQSNESLTDIVSQGTCKLGDIYVLHTVLHSTYPVQKAGHLAESHTPYHYIRVFRSDDYRSVSVLGGMVHMQKQALVSFLLHCIQSLDLIPVILGEQVGDLSSGDIHGLFLELCSVVLFSGILRNFLHWKMLLPGEMFFHFVSIFYGCFPVDTKHNINPTPVRTFV